MNRYHTPYIKTTSQKLSEVKEDLENVRKSLLQRQLEKFSENSNKWLQLVASIAELDCLANLAVVSLGEGMCRPQLINPSSNTNPVLLLQNVRHPCVILKYILSYIDFDYF